MVLLGKVGNEIYLFYRLTAVKILLFFIVYLASSPSKVVSSFFVFTNCVETRLINFYELVPFLSKVSVDHDGGVEVLLIFFYSLFVRVFFRYTIVCFFYWLAIFGFKFLAKQKSKLFQ